jgi:hypothetical protein
LVQQLVVADRYQILNYRLLRQTGLNKKQIVVYWR